MFGISLLVATAQSNPVKDIEHFGGVTSADDGSALKAGPAIGPSHCRNVSFINVLVNSDAPGHYVDDALSAWLR